MVSQPKIFGYNAVMQQTFETPQREGKSNQSGAPGFFRRVSLSQWIIVAMIVGILFGWQFPEAAKQLKIVSTIFLHLIKCIIVPIIFGTLVVGIAGHSDDLKAVGRLAFKSIIYFEIVTTLALAVGLIAVNIVRPGVGVSLAPQPGAEQTVAPQKQSAQAVIEVTISSLTWAGSSDRWKRGSVATARTTQSVAERISGRITASF